MGTQISVGVSRAEMSLDGEQLKKKLIRDYQFGIHVADKRTDYLVDLYAAARWCFLSALTLVAVLILASQLADEPANSTERIVREIRTDPDLLRILEGPRGARGDDGDAPNVNAIVEQVISDPRLKEILEEQLRSIRVGSRADLPATNWALVPT